MAHAGRKNVRKRYAKWNPTAAGLATDHTRLPAFTEADDGTDRDVVQCGQKTHDLYY